MLFIKTIYKLPCRESLGNLCNFWESEAVSKPEVLEQPHLQRLSISFKMMTTSPKSGRGIKME
jgi:hypothetical protein